jgi:hypothetical protein
MFVYTLGESDKTWNGNSCALITITEVSTGKTKTFDDFTYFEDEMDEDEKQFALAEMFYN